MDSPKTGVYKAAVGIRGDMLYCPLPFYIDSYWTCGPNCVHCYGRRLNRTWGWDFRAADVEEVKKKLSSKKGSTPLAKAIQLKKTVRFGNRSDPFQPCEEEYHVSEGIMEFLAEEDWETVIQTKFPKRASRMVLKHLEEKGRNNFLVMPVIMPGLEKDWEVLERKKTENPIERIKTISKLQKKGVRVGIQGEPFIPGYHTVKQFEETMKILKSYGIKSFNTYNLHMNDYVIKNLFEIGLDIEKIWTKNQDEPWRKILRKLIIVAEKYDIVLGNPDFVNSGWGDVQKSNTCCGLNVNNPCTFNSHHFKLAIQKGKDPKDCWDGVGKYEEGLSIIEGTAKGMYTMKDVIGCRPGALEETHPSKSMKEFM